mmetsp:Transcript_27278/g.59238  ORF Transcript_27278/g.59238 Transcript_27278/m.59238 type:complete len:271 (+) Transcript_27278:1-813(+)
MQTWLFGALLLLPLSSCQPSGANKGQFYSTDGMTVYFESQKPQFYWWPGNGASSSKYYQFMLKEIGEYDASGRAVPNKYVLPQDMSFSTELRPGEGNAFTWSKEFTQIAGNPQFWMSFNMNADTTAFPWQSETLELTMEVPSWQFSNSGNKLRVIIDFLDTFYASYTALSEGPSNQINKISLPGSSSGVVEINSTCLVGGVATSYSRSFSPEGGSVRLTLEYPSFTSSLKSGLQFHLGPHMAASTGDRHRPSLVWASICGILVVISSLAM